MTTNNQCGNEQRDWENLSYPKGNYCSVPKFVPFKQNFESANKAVCKVHDNNRGQASAMTDREADWRFLCDFIKRSDLTWGLRHMSGYLSYFAIRLASRNSPKKPQQPLHYKPSDLNSLLKLGD